MLSAIPASAFTNSSERDPGTNSLLLMPAVSMGRMTNAHIASTIR